MLVLSRRKDERIMIANGEIKITVVGIDEDRVRLGIDAPRDIDIHREEIFDLIQKDGPRKSNKKSR
jgi:carbon storage regulator